MACSQIWLERLVLAERHARHRTEGCRRPRTWSGRAGDRAPKTERRVTQGDRSNGGPHTKPAQPQADTVARAVPACSPAMRPAALNTAGITEARPIPRKAKPAIAAAGRPIASPAANPAVAAAASTGRRRDGLKRLSSRLPDSRTVTIASAKAA